MTQAERHRFVSLRSGEWNARFEQPKAFDMESPEALETLDLVKELGFECFVLVLRFVLPVAGPVQVAFSNWRSDWSQRYWSKGYWQIDPVLTRMLSTHRPFDWQDVVPLTPAQKDLFKDAARYGMRDGIAGALRVGSDQGAFFTVSSPQRCDSAVKEQAMARFFLHTGRLFDRVREQLLTTDDEVPIVLTERQREALQLTLRGASRRDASRRMRCSESNFVRHQEAARRKLGETTNYDAVRKAVALNLIRAYDTMNQTAASA